MAQQFVRMTKSGAGAIEVVDLPSTIAFWVSRGWAVDPTGPTPSTSVPVIVPSAGAAALRVPRVPAGWTSGDPVTFELADPSGGGGGGTPSDGSVTNAKVATNAAIAQSKIANLTSDLAAKADLVGGKIPTAQIPAIALVEYLGGVASQSAMLALTGQRGDWCTRTDLGTTWQLVAEPSSTLGSWVQHTYPASPVQSVNGRTAAVTGLAEETVGGASVVRADPTGAQVGSFPAVDVVDPLHHKLMRLVAGTNMTVTVDGTAGTITLAASGGGGGLDLEAVQDAVGAMVVAGTGITATYNDAAGTLTIATTGLAPDSAVVHNTGAETVAGVKTFSSAPVVPDGAFAQAKVTNLTSDLAAKAPLSSPAFTGTPTGITKAHVGLGSVDNTADSAKPVSTAQQAALDLKAPLASPTFTGTVTVPNGSFAIAKTTGLQTALDAKTALSVDGVFQATYDLDTTPVTPGDIGAQPADSDLTAIAALTPTNDDLVQRKAGVWTNRTPAQVKTDLALVKGDVGLGSVDNTADSAKPVSTAQRTAFIPADSAWAAGNAECFSRIGAGGSCPGLSGAVWLEHFKALSASTITKLGFCTSGTGASGTTLARLGLYTVAGNGDLTLVARTASTTTLGNAAYSAFTAVLSNVGGYPTSYTFVPESRYAIGFIMVGTTPCSLSAVNVADGGAGPKISARITGQSDLSTSYTNATAGSHYELPYFYGLAV